MSRKGCGVGKWAGSEGSASFLQQTPMMTSPASLILTGLGVVCNVTVTSLPGIVTSPASKPADK